MTCLASGIILFRRDADCVRLLLLRNRDSGQWGFPKGRRDAEDEHEVSTALREVCEETGWTGLSLQPGFRAELAYLVRDPDGDYDKRVVYFLAESPAPEPTLSDEHDGRLWADRAQAETSLAFGQLRDLARAAFDAAGAA